MDLQLKGKRALVTGSSSGIGRGAAHVLAREGATVEIRDMERLPVAPAQKEAAE